MISYRHAVGAICAFYVALFAVSVVIAHRNRSRPVHTWCLAVPAANNVGRFRCTVTVPTHLRLPAGAVLYVEWNR